MSTENNLSSNIGGATAQSQSVPQTPVFSYPVKGGKINIYALPTAIANFVIVTHQIGNSEFVYAADDYNLFGARSIIKHARAHCAGTNNPFEAMLSDTAAIVEMSVVLDQIFGVSENE